MSDHIQRFLLEDGDVRGAVVQLHAAWRAVLERRSYPAPVRDLLGEATAAVALLAASLKLDGTLTLQLEGDGAVQLLVAQCTGARTVRALARWRGDAPPHDWQGLVGHGRIVLGIEPTQGNERYQGVVDLAGGSLAAALERYFGQSEQLPTRFWFSASAADAGGLMLQRMPGKTGADPDAWDRLGHLAATVRGEELRGLSASELLRRLFHEETLRVFETEPASFRCTCSRERIVAVLRSMGAEDMRALVVEQGAVTTTCEFCGHEYRFDPVDVEQVFAGDAAPPSATRH